MFGEATTELNHKLCLNQQYANNKTRHHDRTRKEKEQLVKLVAELKEKVQKLDLTAPYIPLHPLTPRVHPLQAQTLEEQVRQRRLSLPPLPQLHSMYGVAPPPAATTPPPAVAPTQAVTPPTPRATTPPRAAATTPIMTPPRVLAPTRGATPMPPRAATRVAPTHAATGPLREVLALPHPTST